MEQNQTKGNSWIIVVVIIVLAGAWLLLKDKREFNNESFFMRNNLICEIRKTDDDKSSIGKTITLVDLETDKPRAVFPSGTTSPMKKVSETDKLLTISLVASWTGSTDTITLFKNTGEFTRVETGTTGGNFSFTSSGQCK